MVLTQERAEARSEVIKKNSVEYDFHVALESGDNYSGYSELLFELITVPKELTIDFKGNEVARLLLNGQTSQVNHQEEFIYLDVEKLRVGINKVAISYTNSYDNDGSGCVGFKDVDDKEYIYTQFEPYFAHRVFPCFDQPDLKATMRLNIISPKSWKKVLSNEISLKDKEFNAQQYLSTVKVNNCQQLEAFLQQKSGNMSIFPVTKLLPTYLFCFVAGDYLELELEKEKRYCNIPMSLYCIESLYKYMVELAPFVFQITLESMRFFESFFGYKYPFNKYDQIFAHEYKFGAMENAGIVTFNDEYIFKEKVSTEEMFDFGNTICHELSHHWFGNLVTMKWWDDLWLNQSFADFISHFCLDKIKPRLTTISYQSSMASFLENKGWGYYEDQMITTHPIRAEVANTSVADSIFDGITYSKGAATMKQLLFLMKEENFSKALSEYFLDFEWKNATISDFLAYMQKHFTINDFTLQQWKEQWLEKASLNIIKAEWKPENKSDNAELIIHQTPYKPEHPTLRFHKIKVGLFKQDFSVDVIEVLLLPQGQTVTHYDGSRDYKAVLLNFEDQTFAKNTIDPISLDFFIKNINKITDLLSRTLIWRTFYEMIKDAEMPSNKYVEVVTQCLPSEPSDTIFQKQLGFIHTSINSYTPIPFRSQLNKKMFNFIYELIPKIPAEYQNRLVVLKNKLLNFAKGQEEIQLLIRWMNGKDENLKEMTIGQKWTTVEKAFTMKSLTIEEKEAIFQTQRKEDPSDTAKNYRFTCNSLKSTEQEFEQIYLSFHDKDSKVSVAVKTFISNGLNHPYHAERLQKYKKRYFQDISNLMNVLDGDHYSVFYNNFEPIDDDLEGNISLYEEITFPEGKELHSRNILKIIDDLKRRQRAYSLWE